MTTPVNEEDKQQPDEQQQQQQPSIQKVGTLSQLLTADANDPSSLFAFGQVVVLHGWIYGSRSQGAGTLQFLDVGDGSTVLPIRCVVSAEQYNNNNTSGQQQQQQAVPEEADYTTLSFEQLKSTTHLCTGCSVQIIGTIVQPPEGTTQSVEISVLLLKLIGGVADASKYPIQKSLLKKPIALRKECHARFRAPLIQTFMHIRSQALFAIHEFFFLEKVPLLDPNILTSSDCEGAGEVFKVTPQFFSTQVEKKKKKTKKPKQKLPDDATEGVAQLSLQEDTTKEDEEEDDAQDKQEQEPPPLEVGLTVSSQLPLEAMAMGTGSVYTCQKSFRAEHSDTNKHLAEFLHVEFEQYFITLPELVNQAERYVKHVIATVLDRCVEHYQFLDNAKYAPAETKGHCDYLRSLLDKPFVRVTHREAIDILQQDSRDKTTKWINEQGKEARLRFKEPPLHGHDLSSAHERYLVQKFGTFVFVTHWPSPIKSFYMKQVGDGTCECFDLLAPIVGELFGGSMREWRHNVLDTIMQSKQMDMRPLQWYLDLRKDGTAPHGGWGMGFDRLVMFLCNTQSVRDVVPYPVYYGYCPY